MATSDTKICNVALGMAGISRIQSIDGQTTVEKDCRAIYDDARNDVLAVHDWPFARHFQELSQLSSTPLSGYSYAYQLPADNLRAIRLNDPKEHFEIIGDELHCNVASGVVLRYTRLVTDAAKFTAAFTTLMQHRLAPTLAMMIKKDKKLSMDLMDVYLGMQGRLEVADSKGEFREEDRSNPYLQARNAD